MSSASNLEMLDKLQKRLSKIVALHMLSLLNLWLVVKIWPALVFSMGITYGRCLSERLSCLFFFFVSYSTGRSTDYSNMFLDFAVNIPKCYKDVSNQFLSTGII